jgi:hypothetical protein
VVWKDRHCGREDRCACIKASNGDLDVCSSCVWAVHSRRVRAAQDGRRRDMATAPAHPRRCTCLVAVAYRRRVSTHLYMTTRKSNAGSSNRELRRDLLHGMLHLQNVPASGAQTLSYAHHQSYIVTALHQHRTWFQGITRPNSSFLDEKIYPAGTSNADSIFDVLTCLLVYILYISSEPDILERTIRLNKHAFLLSSCKTRPFRSFLSCSPTQLQP